MKYALCSTALFCGLFTFGATAQQGNEASRMKSPDSTFVTKAAQGGMAEVELGTLATQRASNQKVKDFGQKMVDDHSKANEELKALASQKGVQLPTAIDAKSQAMKTRLTGLQGAAFDRAYMQHMVTDHEHDVAEFQKEADHGADPDVKNFAAKTLPTLQGHLKMAQDTLGDVKSAPAKQ